MGDLHSIEGTLDIFNTLNVNTVLNSGERMPSNVFNGTPNFTMEAVFNVESLRRIIKIGRMTFIDSAGNPVEINPLPNQSFGEALEDQLLTQPLAKRALDRPLAWNKHENLRTKLAYQYQEVLCRYFTATYRHSARRKWPPIYNPTQPPAVTPPTEDFSEPGTYQTAFAGNALPVQYACQSWDYSKTRFPVNVLTFRQQIKEDLLILSARDVLAVIEK